MNEPHRYFGKVEAATQLLLIELFNNLENTVAHTLRPDKVLDDLLVCTVQYIKGENRKCLADWLKVNRTKT